MDGKVGQTIERSMADPKIGLDEAQSEFKIRALKADIRRPSVAALLTSIDLAHHSLGPRQSWDPSLSSVIALMVDSHFPMFVAWGDELTFFYNDAYAEILGNKHPAAFGAKFKDIWHEIWDDIYPLIDKAMNGISTRP